MSIPKAQLMTVDDLLLMPDDSNRYEVIEGELFVTRAPNYEHQAVITTLAHLIATYLERNPIGFVVAGPGVIFSHISGVIPDLIFLTHKTRKRVLSGGKLKGAPELAIEIVSPGAESRRRDRVAKRALYGKYGVREYWIVDYKTRTVEVCALEQKVLQTVAKLGERDVLTSTVLPGFTCDVAAIFANLD
ncbi:MAG TPA: Uma2 family endonuclease [Blastocatellia bacterium]|nr:Uma2 family endonuclease [Blastocatellia bacterium]